MSAVKCVVPICPFLIPALSDSQSNSLLNGNFVVAMFKREITFKGTVIEYSGSDTKVERINCTERIEEELVLQVLRGSVTFSSNHLDKFNPDFCSAAYYSAVLLVRLLES